ncbi:hypothetical protein F5Y02DRAFT_329777 [Annulohypoxylon stygium]|nr:hypothetical protein F5Y02DRAFT_329777 [Annulohypoxylon stygium]
MVGLFSSHAYLHRWAFVLVTACRTHLLLSPLRSGTGSGESTLECPQKSSPIRFLFMIIHIYNRVMLSALVDPGKTGRAVGAEYVLPFTAQWHPSRQSRAVILLF